MCGPRIRKPAPGAATTPTMQAADELELITDGLSSEAIGRAALRTSSKGGARAPASSAAAAAVAAPGGAALPGSTPTQDAGGDGDAAGTLGLGREPGSRQPFYNPLGPTQP